MEIHNSSTLSTEEFNRIDQELKSGLQTWGIGTSEFHAGMTRVVVTISQNLQGFVWTAEVHQGENSQVIFAITAPLENRIASSAMRMTIHGEKFWEGPERIVDVTFVFLPNLEQRMVLLVPEGLIITKVERGAAVKRVQFPPPETKIGNRTEALTRLERGSKRCRTDERVSWIWRQRN